MSGQEPSVGILGSGQLARYLAQAGLKKAAEIRVLCNFLDDPAAQLSVAKIIDRGTDESRDLFLAGLDVVLFENEFIRTDFYKASKFQPRFFPDIPSLKRLSFKHQQKEMIDQLRIPTAPWRLWPSATEDLGGWLADCERIFPEGFVLKWSKYGYDGYGNRVVDGRPTLAEQQFCRYALGREVPVFAEQRIHFDQELSLIGCRTRSDEFFFFPLVISHQMNGACYWVKGPATSFSISSEIESTAQTYATQIARESNLYGVFAVEFFLEKEKGLLVNEIAPRVHNTGHFSLSAANQSQFEIHLRASLGEEISPITTKKYFGMVNILGRFQIPNCPEQVGPDILNSEFFWYGKKEMRKGRKMGHLNFWADNREAFDEMSEQVKKWEDSFWINLKAEARID